jgi:hypothetical protein
MRVNDVSFAGSSSGIGRHPPFVEKGNVVPVDVVLRKKKLS